MAVAAAQRTVLKMGIQNMEEESLSLEQSQWLDFVFVQVSYFHNFFICIVALRVPVKLV